VNNPQNDNLIEVKNLKVYFPVLKGLLRKKVADVKAVDDVSFVIKRGETLGLVGESGCGKTTIGKTILHLYRPTGGTILFDNYDISQVNRSKMRPYRRKMQLIFQDPYNSLDPRQNAGNIVGEPMKIHKIKHGTTGYGERVKELFRMVGLDPSMINRYPHEFSGGQRQRIGIARALSSDPSFIICDEPISALDVSIQAQIINLLQELQQQLHLTYLFIAHDLSIVRHISSRVAVMYLGHIVEITDSKELYSNPLHPYTKALLSAVPIPDPFVEEKRERIILKGDVPSPMNPPKGCCFHPRCPIAIPSCKDSVPVLKKVAGEHDVACFRVQ
jgi:peptide/nickel transport system ATP-binding protein